MALDFNKPAPYPLTEDAFSPLVDSGFKFFTGPYPHCLTIIEELPAHFFCPRAFSF